MAIIKVANTGLDALPSQVEMLDVLTFDGSQSYSLTKNSVAFTPASADSILVSVNGIVQSGENFTVSGSTIDFGEAIPSTSVCDFIFQLGTGVLNTPVDNSVTTAKIVDGAVSSAKMFSGFANGITMADQWRLSANTNSGTNDVISTNWERNDDSNYSSLGTGLTESSGVFSFAQTGLYLINGTFSIFLNSGDAGGNVFFQYYISDVANDAALTSVDVDNNYTQATSGFIFNVTDISTHKFRFLTSSFNSGTVVYGNSNYNFSFFTAIRLGDSQ